MFTQMSLCWCSGICTDLSLRSWQDTASAAATVHIHYVPFSSCFSDYLSFLSYCSCLQRLVSPFPCPLFPFSPNRKIPPPELCCMVSFAHTLLFKKWQQFTLSKSSCFHNLGLARQKFWWGVWGSAQTVECLCGMQNTLVTHKLEVVGHACNASILNSRSPSAAWGVCASLCYIRPISNKLKTISTKMKLWWGWGDNTAGKRALAESY